MLKKIVIFFILILWPLNLILNHDFPKSFPPKTIFYYDYQAQQLILRNTYLYPDVLIARIFQNKARIYIDKYLGNFFALVDPNNYFFGLHPRPIVPDNKNLFKFPFFAIVFFGYGLYFITNYKYKRILGIISTFLVLSLSLLGNFDGYDFILWVPISIVIIHGVNLMQKKDNKMFNIASIIFLLFAIPEFIRSFVR